MATQLRLLEDHEPESHRTEDRRVVERNRSPRVQRRSGGTGPRTVAPAIRERLDDNTRTRGLRGVAAARQALHDANRRMALREAERRRAKQAGLVELAGRARVIASSPDESLPTTPHFPDGNAAA